MLKRTKNGTRAKGRLRSTENEPRDKGNRIKIHAFSRVQRLLLVAHRRYKSYEGHWVKTGYRRRYRTPQTSSMNVTFRLDVAERTGERESRKIRGLTTHGWKETLFPFRRTDSTLHTQLSPMPAQLTKSRTHFISATTRVTTRQPPSMPRRYPHSSPRSALPIGGHLGTCEHRKPIGRHTSRTLIEFN